MKYFSIAILSLVLSAPASAALMHFSGDFEVTIPTLTFPVGGTNPVPTLVGNWSFEFDQPSAPAVGSSSGDLALTTFNMTPNTIGATSFTLTNTGAHIFYDFPDQWRIYIGGLRSGAGGVASGDDFSISYTVAPSNGEIFGIGGLWRTGEPTIAGVGNGTGAIRISQAAVPTPATLALFGLGLLGLLFRRKI